MKRTALIVIILFLSLPTFAQSKYGEDSVKCVKNLSLYRDYYKQKMYDEAYKFWRIAYTICPQSSERMYVDGFNLIEHRLKNAASEEEKAAYTDTLLAAYDQRIKYFGREGYVLGRKGADMLRYAKDDIEAIYKTLQRSVQLEGKESNAGALVSYMNVTAMMEKKDKLEKDTVVQTFLVISDILSYNLQKQEGKKAGYYERAQKVIEKIASPYLSCDILIKMAEDNFEKNKTDAEWLARTSKLLDRKNCSESTIFFQIAKELHDLNPSARSAYSMGVMHLKKKHNQKAIDYFKDAIEMEEEIDKTYAYYIALAQTYSNMGAYSKGRAAARNASKIRTDEGMPYMMIGNMIAASSGACKTDDPCISKAIYWLAEDYFVKAKSVDPSIAETANKRISSNKKYFPSQNDCFFKSIKAGDTVEIKCWIGESTKARFN